MKVSSSAPSSASSARRSSARVWTAAVVVMAVYFAAHLPFLAPSLEDIDSINFALGLREFDVARHQPHPPGSPVFIALGRVSLAVITATASGLDPTRAEALALAFWSALGSAIALVAAWVVFSELDIRTRAPDSGRRAAPEFTLGPARSRAPLWGTALLAVAPLFWVTALRPMSDMAGLAAALAAQALTLTGRRKSTWLTVGALVAGVAAGIRVQTLWLTVPLLAVVMFEQRRTGVWWLASRPFAAFVAGCLAWAIPLLAASGGLNAYLLALGSQAGEDFAWVDMLWSNPTPRRLALALYETLVLPWASTPLAVVVGLLAAAGASVALVRNRSALALACVAFAPHVLLHLLLQETIMVRYALPVVPAVAWLAARSIAAAGRLSAVVAVPVLASAAWSAATGGIVYGREPYSAFRSIADMTTAAAREAPAAIYAHYDTWRPLQAGAPPGVPVVPPERNREWMGLVEYWRGGGAARVWFLASARRTDLELIDPQARRNVVSYRWAAGDRPELSSSRPTGVDWYRFDPPGWFAGEGWSLTPETGGLTRAAGTGVDRRPIEALVRRRPERMFTIVGVRHLGTASDPSTSFTVALDGRVLDAWTLDPMRAFNALRILELPAGSLNGAGPYARLTITAQAVLPDTPTPPVAVRQFDIQPDTGIVHGFDEGWHEEEYDNASGRRWRWTSDRSVMRIVAPQGVRLTIRGESPMTYFDAPPKVRVMAGERLLARFEPAADFEWRVAVPSDAVQSSGGRIAIETDRVYLPGPAEGTADERRLGLRLYGVDVAGLDP
jgi:hypothetical protein